MSYAIPGLLTPQQKSGVINILNDMMKSPQLIEVYKQKNQWPTYVIEETGCNSNFKIQFKGKV